MKNIVKSSEDTSFHPKETSKAKILQHKETERSLGFNSFLSWRGLIGVIATVIIAYQYAQLKSIQSQLATQEARIIQLEINILKNLGSSSNSLTAKNEATSGVADSPKDGSSVQEHVPHYHYAIETIDGVPVNPGKSLYFLIAYNRCRIFNCRF